MQPLATVVALGAAPARAAARLDAAQLSCEVLDSFTRMKQAHGGSLLLLLLDDAGDAALAGATKAARILQRRGGGEAIVVLPRLEANPGPQARGRLQRAAELSNACVVQPVRASWAEAVRCFVEPLAVYGLAGVDARDIHALASAPRYALLHAAVSEALPDAKDLLVSCRLRPNSSLGELDRAVRTAAERAPRARLVIAGPEVGDEGGPAALAASLF